MDKLNFMKNSGLTFMKSMENKSTKHLSCSNCSQLFSVRDPLHPRGVRCPLVLQCGHSACENCVRMAVQNLKRVVCSACKQISVPLHPEGDIRENFPLNIYLLGVYSARHQGHEPQDFKIAFVPAGSSNCSSRRTSTSSLNKWKEQKKEPCSECSERDAEWRCLQCEVPYCGHCYTKVHKAARALSKHKKLPFDTSSLPVPLSVPMCDTHVEQKLEFYCKECDKMVCSHCIICIHQGHSIITKRQKNEAGIAKLEEAREKAAQVMKRLLHTQKKLSEVLVVPMPGTNVASVEKEVANHFVYLHGALQLLEMKIMERLTQTKTQKSQNMDNIINDLNSNIQNIKQLIKHSLLAKDVTKLDKMEVDELTNKLLETENLPCHLISTEGNTSESLLRFVVDKSFMQQVETHCEVEFEDISLYKLVRTDDLPPDSVVEPIEDDEEYEAMISVNSRASSMSTLSDVFPPEASAPAQNDNAARNVNRHKRNSKEYAKGSSDLVTVCHVRDPVSFFVHRIVDTPSLEQLTSQLTKHAGSFNSPPDSVLVNGLYIVQYSKDKQWYRARVRSMQPSSPDEEDMVDVLYIDYGNSEIIPVSKLRCIPPRFANDPALALHCSLFGIVPVGGKWTQDSVKTFAKMVHGYHVKMVVMDYVPDTYQVDLCQIPGETLENDVPLSVRDALVFLEFACFVDEEKFKIPVMEKTSKYFEENGFKKGSVVEVLTSHIDSPHSFYVQRLGDHARYLSSVMSDMNKEYSNASNKGWIYKPQVGMPCAAQFSLDKKWYRAKVTDLPGNKRVEVFYVDYGNQEVIFWNQLRKLQPQFLKFPAQAIHCSLSDVVPNQQLWTVEVKRHMEKVTAGKVLRLYVDDIQRHQLKVTLYNSQEEVDICINGLLVRDGFATSVGVSSSLVEYHKLDGLPYQLPPVTKKPVTTKYTKKRPAPLVKPPTASTPVDVPDKVHVEVPKEEDPFRLEVRVLSCPSPSCIWVAVASQEEQIQSLMCELQSFYSNSSSHIDKWEVLNKCCAFSVKNKQWYRAKIIELLPDNQAKVFLRDFAEVEIVPLLNLQLIDPKFLEIRDGAIKCHLAGVKAAGDRNEWTTLACEYLVEQIDKYTSIYITKKGEIEDSSLPVELWVKNVIHGGPFEPTKEEWLTLNNKLTEQGLAIPVRGDTECQSIPSVQVLKELDEQSRDANKNSVSEWLQLSAQHDGSLKTESSDPPVDVSEYNLSEIDESTVEEEAAAIPSTISDWLPVVPATKKKFTGTPTFVDDDCCIYLHDTESSADTLTLIGNALHSRFKNSQPKPHDQYWFANQLCIAQYHSDKKWYRGRVVEVNDEDRIVKVMFVDYGNIEDCKAAELRKNIYMTEIPIQCYKCQLEGIRPATEDGKWPVDTLDFIHTTIVEKQCYVTIKEEPRIGKPYVISLIGPGNIDIGELLVRMQFAIYSNPEFDSTPLSDLGTMDEEDQSVVIEHEEEEIVIENEVEESDDAIENIKNLENESQSKEESHCEESIPKDTISSISDENVQWNDLIDIEEEQKIQGASKKKTDVRYKKLDLTDCESIAVEVTAILSANEIVVHPWKSDNSKLATLKEEFIKLTLELQESARKQPIIKKAYIGQPCCACYTEDNLWYRAAIVAIELRESKLKIQYVDYGNVEHLPMDKVHTLKPEWAEVPVMGIRCQLWQIQRPQEWDPEKLFPKMMQCVFQPPLIARIKVLNPVLEVELLTQDGSSLVCQPLLDEGLLIKTEEKSEL